MTTMENDWEITATADMEGFEYAPPEHADLAIVQFDRWTSRPPRWWDVPEIVADWINQLDAEHTVLICGRSALDTLDKWGLKDGQTLIGGWLGRTTRSMPRIRLVGEHDVYDRDEFRYMRRDPDSENLFDVPLAAYHSLLTRFTRPGGTVWSPINPQKTLIETIAIMNRRHLKKEEQ